MNMILFWTSRSLKVSWHRTRSFCLEIMWCEKVRWHSRVWANTGVFRSFEMSEGPWETDRYKENMGNIGKLIPKQLNMKPAKGEPQRFCKDCFLSGCSILKESQRMVGIVPQLNNATKTTTRLFGCASMYYPPMADCAIHYPWLTPEPQDWDLGCQHSWRGQTSSTKHLNLISSPNGRSR